MLECNGSAESMLKLANIVEKLITEIQKLQFSVQKTNWSA